MSHEISTMEIGLSKNKIIKQLFVSICFIGIGIWLLVKPPVISNPYFGNPTVILCAGIASIILFSIFAIMYIQKLRSSALGLIIDKQGITDNSSALSVGLIAWSDIENISVMEMYRQKLIMIKVNKPEEYIARQANSMKRKMMEMNYKTYHTPISITSNILQIKFDELLHKLTSDLEKSRA